MGSKSNGWTFDEFDDGSAKKMAVEKETARLQEQIEKSVEKLHKYEDEMEDSIQVDHTNSPFNFETEPFEEKTTIHVVKTDNKILNKIVLALSSLSCEINQLSKEARQNFYPSLVIYGEDPEISDPKEGDIQLMVGEMMDFFQKLCCFVTRIYDVVKNVLHQLANLYNERKKVAFESNDIHFSQIYESLADALAILVHLDQIISSNEALGDHWKYYKRMVTLVRTDPVRFGTDENKLKLLEKMLQQIEGTLIDGSIFQNALFQQYDYADLVNVTKNQILISEISINLRAFFSSLDERIDEPNETEQRYKFVGFCALFVFFTKLFRPPQDPKFFKTIWLTYKKLPIVSIFGNITWTPTEFFVRYLPNAVQQLGKQDVVATQKAFMKKLDDTLPNLAQEWHFQICIWAVRFNSEPLQKNTVDVISVRIPVVIQGYLFARSISNLVKQVLGLHLQMQTATSKKVVLSLCKLIETLKSIEDTFRQKRALLAESIPYMCQYLCISVARVLQPYLASFNGKKMTTKALDTFAALSLAIGCLNGPPTKERFYTFQLALSIIIQSKILKQEELNEIRNLTRKLETLSNFTQLVKEACSCDFLYWSREVLPLYFTEVFNNPNQSYTLPYMTSAIRDVLPILEKSTHKPLELIEKLDNEITDMVKETIISPLSREIETDLRLHIHHHLKLDDRNPFRVGLKDSTPLVNIPPLLLLKKTLDIKNHVTAYLDTTFYNLTSVALHDWRTYTEMRNLAHEKYGLEMIEVHLPSGTLEQGIDALQIMRNIHVFVSQYNYNINNQIFVEKESNNKHLNTISIRHIANSIRTHGTGVMNTTVNVTYQLLVKKFKIFTQFLYDDYIKSRLIKEVRYFRESKDEIDQKYPYDRAEKFTKTIRKLGVKEGQTYLDQFRVLITTIGNAMGYIRMVRSGGLHHCSNAINFVPDIKNILAMEDLVREEYLSSESVGASINFDSAVANLTKNFTESTDYFQLLVDVFANQLRDPKNAHLKNFHCIIPALTLNFVEYIISCKDKLDKKRKDGAAFSDDGFAMGIAYILKLLDQNTAFESLHWFTSVYEHYTNEARKLDSQRGKKSDEQQSILLTKQKLLRYRKEFELLYFSLTGARIFFREEGENFSEATKRKEGDQGAETASMMGVDEPGTPTTPTA